MANIRTVRQGVYKVTWEVAGEGARRQRSRTFRTQAAAKDWRDARSLEERRSIGTVKMSLSEFLETWVAEKTKSVERNTLAGYQRWISHISHTAAARVPLERVTALTLENAYAELLARPAGKGRPLSPMSVRHVHAVMQNALGDAARHQRIPSNPAIYAKPPKGQSPKVTTPSPAQVDALLDDIGVHNPDLLDLVSVIIATGLRRSEVRAVQCSQLKHQSAKALNPARAAAYLS
jgi:site-specific recombinase XerD